MNFIKYSAINSKIHSLSSHLLTTDDYRELLSKSSVVEIIRYLKEKTIYSEVLKDKNPDEMHRRDLEVLIRNRRVDAIKKFLHFFHQPERDFLDLILKKFEIENLKLAIRNALTSAKESERDISHKFYNLDPYTTIDPIKIATSDSTEEILRELQHTRYYTEVKNILESYGESKRNLVYLLETALDKWHLTRINKVLKLLNKSDREIIEEIIGKQIDLMNAEWIIRVKLFYNLSPEELFNSLIHTGYKLKNDYLKLACNSRNAIEAIELFTESHYGEVFTNIAKDKKISVNLTNRIHRYIHNVIMEKRLSREFSLAKLLEYIFSLEFEFADIILITEAVRYSLKNEEIIRHLSRPITTQ